MPSPHWQSRNAAAGVEDMVLLRQLNDDAIVENLRKRLATRAIFTYIGPVLVSVNPFAEVEKFGEQQMEQYQGAAQYENPPHIFALADSMFRNVIIDRERQCVIISGESGAGKTVIAKHIMAYLAHSSGGGQRVQRVKETILKSNPLLEAFGNAATTRNWNSSRFGKYVEIVFSPGGEPLGGRISSFLLEKSRVVQTSPGERNFHIFYQLLEGADPELRRQLGLSKPDYYAFLNCSGCYRADGTDDRKEFAETRDAMRAVGLDENSQFQCLAVVAAALHIGNITFAENAEDGFASVADAEYLQFPAFLLGLTAEAIKEKLTCRQLQSKWGATKEQVDVRLNREQAAYTRNAWAKALYARLFDFLVATVNNALDVDTRRHSMDLSIGVLDIYGFEVFERNGFEQFCINFVNEKLQQIFVELTLKAEQEEYQSEGIQWTPVEFFNNKVVCDLIEAKRPPGIMPILDDICAQIHGQSEGVDEKMLTKLSKQLQGHEHFRPGAGAFLVQHYAGEVLYQVDGFCDRNRDILHADLVQLMMGSSNPFMCQLFVDCATADPNKKPTSASSKIRSQANHLMDSLMRCVPHYVRCIKPNERKRALDFDGERVLHQVRYLGLRENIRVRRAGFVYRRPFERFLWRYAICCARTWPRWTGEPRAGCELICREGQLAEDEFRLGRTKIFIRNPESLFLLEEARERKYDGFARIIQRTFRRFAAKRHLIRQKDEASELLRGLKERNQHSLERRFVADYIGLDQHPGLQAIVGRRERIYFAAIVTKYDRRFKTTRVDVLLTGKCLFLIGRELLKTGVNKGKLVEAVKRQIPLAQIRSVTISPLQDDFLLLSVADSHCSLLETPLKTELLAALNKRCKERAGRPLPLQFRDRFVVLLKQVSSFPAAAALIGGTERQVEFRHAASGGQAVRVQTKPNGRSMQVLVAKGMPPDSRPSGQRRFIGQQQQQRQNGTATAPNRPPHHQPQQQHFVKNGAAAASLQPHHHHPQQQQLASVLAQKAQQQQGRHHQVAPQPRPPPLKPKPAVKPRGPMLRTLYPYEAQDTDELSFGKDQMLELVKKDESGWWTGRLNGRAGLLPANYVEEV